MAMEITELEIKFCDGLSYNPQSLAKWHETFGLSNISKGTYPHKFNRPITWDRILPIPKICEYGYDTISVKEWKTFLSGAVKKNASKQGFWTFVRRSWIIAEWTLLC